LKFSEEKKFYNFFKILHFFLPHFLAPGSGSGSKDPIESGSDPDPKHCAEESHNADSLTNKPIGSFHPAKHEFLDQHVIQNSHLLFDVFLDGLDEEGQPEVDSLNRTVGRRWELYVEGQIVGTDLWRGQIVRTYF